MVLPMAEMVGWLRKGVGALIRQAGPERTANRWGSERGYCSVSSIPSPKLPHTAKFIDDPQQDDGNLGSPFKTVVGA